MSRRASSASTAGRIALLLGLASTALYAAISRGVFVYGDDVLMFQVTEAIVERGDFAVSSRAPAGETTHAVIGADGRRYSKYGLAPSLVALPLDAIAKPLFAHLRLPETRDDFGNLRTGAAVFGAGLTNAVVGGAAVAVTFLLALELGATLVAALAAALLLATATLWPHYAATFLSEPLAGLALAVALLGLLRGIAGAEPAPGRGELRWTALSGFAGGMAVATKIALLPVFALAALLAAPSLVRASSGRFRAKQLLCWSFFFFLWVAAILAYNERRFDSVWETGYGAEATAFGTPWLAGIGGLLLSPAKGLLWYVPLVVLSLAGLGRLLRLRRGVAWPIAAMLLTHLLISAKYYQWHGGGVWGPRLLVPLLPLLLASAAVALSGIARRSLAFRWAVAVLVVASLATTAAGIVVPFDRSGARLPGDPAAANRDAWELARSPLLAQLGELPRALPHALGKLAGVGVDTGDGAALAAAGVPDVAFVRYGSHALLQWSRGALVLAAIFFALALRAAARAQKALLSRPPQ